LKIESNVSKNIIKIIIFIFDFFLVRIVAFRTDKENVSHFSTSPGHLKLERNISSIRIIIFIFEIFWGIFRLHD
jgi:hypothetical protein